MPKQCINNKYASESLDIINNFILSNLFFMSDIIIITTQEKLDFLIKKSVIEILEQYKNNRVNDNENRVGSISELACLLHCCNKTAQDFKNMHPELFYQTGKKFFAYKKDILEKIKLK